MILEKSGNDCIAVGKRCGKLSTAQAFINKQLIDQAAKCAVVVRLKGGDPMLFGRADEELRALEALGRPADAIDSYRAAMVRGGDPSDAAERLAALEGTSTGSTASRPAGPTTRR